MYAIESHYNIGVSVHIKTAVHIKYARIFEFSMIINHTLGALPTLKCRENPRDIFRY